MCNKQKQNKAVIYGLSKQYQVKTKTNYDTDEQQLWPSYVIMKYSSRKIDKSFVDKKNQTFTFDWHLVLSHLTLITRGKNGV